MSKGPFFEYQLYIKKSNHLKTEQMVAILKVWLSNGQDPSYRFNLSPTIWKPTIWKPDNLLKIATILVSFQMVETQGIAIAWPYVNQTI